MPIVRWTQAYSNPNTELNLVTGDDLSSLAIREAASTPGFFYFYDTSSNRLITDFVLCDRPRVALMCQVAMVRKDNRYSPRIRLWKKDKTKVGKTVAQLQIPDNATTRLIKASVDTDEGHENFWKVINYLQSIAEIDVPRNVFRVVDGESAELVELMQEQNRNVLLNSLRTALGGSLTEYDITVLANRKAQVDHFRHLLTDPPFFEAEKVRTGTTRSEALWQTFFEENSWIFGYGLTLVTCESLTDGKLESVTTGANIFSGGGKRIDALMKTRALVSSLLFCEIKKHDTKLLKSAPYRPPDVYQPSDELSGGVAQLQKTTRKAERQFVHQIESHTKADGTPSGIDFSTSRPRQVLLIGSLDEFRVAAGINGEMMESFELYRTSFHGLEIITFDELYERARFIINDNPK